MDQIYSNAWIVIAWLGSSENVRTDIVEALARHLEGTKREQRQFSTREEADCHRDPCAACSYSIGYHDEHREGGTQVWDPPRTSDVTELSYWSRLWIKQELVLANDIHFLVETHRFSRKDIWEHLCLLNEVDRDANDNVDENLCGTSALSSLDSITDPYRQSQGLELDQVVDRFTSLGIKCSKKHDLVFGLLSMIHPARRMLIDYNLPTPTLLERTLENMLYSPTLRQSILEPVTNSYSFEAYLDHLVEELGTTPNWHVWLDIVPSDKRSRNGRWGVRPMDIMVILAYLEQGGFDKSR